MPRTCPNGEHQDDGDVHRSSAILRHLHWVWSRHTPSLLQGEGAECGLACLTMIAQYYGHQVDLRSMRQRFCTSLKGVDLAQLISIAESVGLIGRPVRLELDELTRINAPCILHWDLDHFIVLRRATSRHLFINDPARGGCKLKLHDASKHFTGVALELIPAVDFQPIKRKQRVSLRALVGKMNGITRAFLQVGLLALALELFSLITPFYMQWVVDSALPSADYGLLTLLGIAFVGVVVFQAIFSCTRSWAITRIGITLNVQWMDNLFGHMLRLPLQWFEGRHIGDIVSRFSSIHSIRRTLTTQFVAAMLSGIMSLTTIAILWVYDVTAALLVLTAPIAYGFLRWLFFHPLYRANEKRIACEATQHSELMESIRGILPIKLACMHHERRIRYADSTINTANNNIAVERLEITFDGISQALFGLSRVVVIWFLAVEVLDGHLTVGMLVAFLAYTVHFHSRSADLIDKALKLRMVRLHVERLSDIALSNRETSVEDAVGSDIGALPADVEFHDVNFRYAKTDPWILRDCSFRVRAGQRVAIVGPSGCGKTTLIKVLLGLLQPSSGEVYFGGRDIRQLGLDGYRAVVGAVMQEDCLFAGNIMENIAFFDPAAQPTDVEAAAQAAGIHEEICQMPMRYRTFIGDMGSSLSGGQRQRIILARALYRRPKLLILDEATSHLDSKCTAVINVALGRTRATRFVISHDRTTLGDVDHTLVFKDGSVQLDGL